MKISLKGSVWDNTDHKFWKEMLMKFNFINIILLMSLQANKLMGIGFVEGLVNIVIWVMIALHLLIEFSYRRYGGSHHERTAKADE